MGIIDRLEEHRFHLDSRGRFYRANTVYYTEVLLFVEKERKKKKRSK